MKICHVVGDSQYGGGSRIVLSLLAAAVQAGHEVAVVATNERFVKEVGTAGGRAVTLDCVRRQVNPFWDIAGCWRLMRHIRAERYDLVHTHTTKGGLVGRLAAWLARVTSIVHTVHGFAFHEESRPAVVRLLALIEKIGALFCDRLVTVSHYHRRWALELGIAEPDKILAIPNGIEPLAVDPSFDRARFRSALGVQPHEFLLLGLGRLAPQKGFGHLLDCMSELSRSRPDCRLLIAGTGPLATDLEQRIAALNLTEHATLLGFRTDIAELYLAADIIVQPSLWEGLSISLLEAMSLGQPLVTTGINSNQEVLAGHDAARIVPVKDPRALAAAILELAGDEAERTAMGTRARRLFHERYLPEDMTTAYLECYESLWTRQDQP